MLHIILLYLIASWSPNSKMCVGVGVWGVPHTSKNDAPSHQPDVLQFKSVLTLSTRRLKLKLQYFGHLMRRADSLEKTWCWERLKTGREGDDRGWDGWLVSPTQWTWVWASSGRWWRTRKPGVLQSMGSQRVRDNLRTEKLRDDIQYHM